MNGLGRASRGFSLIETLIALGIFGAIGVAFMSGLTSSFRAADMVDERARAEIVARSVLEYVRSKPYLDNYNCPPESGCPSAPAGYSYTLTTAPYMPDNKIQKNTANVFRHGQRLTELSDLKAKR